MARDALPKPRPTEVLPTIEDADRTKKASVILLVVPRVAVAWKARRVVGRRRGREMFARSFVLLGIGVP